MHCVLVTRHVFHVSKSFSTEVTWEVSDTKVNSDTVSVEIELAFEFLSTVWAWPLWKFCVYHPHLKLTVREDQEYFNDPSCLHEDPVW